MGSKIQDNCSSVETQAVPTFTVQIKPIWRLRNAVHALSDSSFNPKRLAWCGLVDDAFIMGFKNSETGLMGCLFMTSDEIRNYAAVKSFEPRVFDLNQLLSVLEQACFSDPLAFDNAVTIRYVSGSSDISIVLANGSVHSIALNNLVVYLEPSETFQTLFMVLLKSDQLRHILPLLSEGKSQAVSVEVKEGLLNFSIGDNSWELRLLEGQMKNLSSVKEHAVWFTWPHVNLLWSALAVDRHFGFTVDSSNVPACSVELQFCVMESCRLFFRQFNRRRFNFEFQVKLVPGLKLALASLANPYFQSQAFLEVTDKKCSIAVKNSESGVEGLLLFEDADFLKPPCLTPLSRSIDIGAFGDHVLTACPDEVLSISQVDGSNEVLFKFGIHLTAYSAKCCEENADEYRCFPRNSVPRCSIELASEELRHLLSLIYGIREAETVLEIKEGYITFNVEKGRLTVFSSELIGHNCCNSFVWPHSHSLLWLPTSFKDYTLCILLQDDGITLEVHLETGTLLYRTAFQRHA